MKHALAIAAMTVAISLFGCKDDHSHNDGHSHKKTAPATNNAEGHTDKNHPKLSLGTKQAGGYDLAAYQTGPISEGEFDLEVANGPGKPKAVRFWVGTENAEGSVKARAEEEKPGHWHIHPEIPNPLPAGSQFWVEIDPPTGEKLKASFDMKP